MDYGLCGWHVSSELPLPELLPWTGSDAPEIRIRIGAVEKPAGTPWQGGPVAYGHPDGTCLLAHKGVASYLIRNGCEIVVDPELPPDTPDIALFLLSSCLGVLCHQRGLVPLHASCVAIRNHAYAFAGEAGCGKTTIAAAMLSAGAELVADDVVAVDVAAPGGPLVWPGVPRLKLWRNTMEALNLSPLRRLRTAVSLEKYSHPVPDAFRTAAIPLRRIYYVYRFASDRNHQAQPVSGRYAFDLLRDHIYRSRIARTIGLDKQIFMRSASLTSAVAQFKLMAPNGLPDVLSCARGIFHTLAEAETP